MAGFNADWTAAMQQAWPLIAAAGVMGLTGSLHCLVMCSTLHAWACHTPANGQPGGCTARRPNRQWSFQSGRVCGYVLLGGVVGASSNALWSATSLHPALRTTWIVIQAALLVHGLATLVLGRQPALTSPPLLTRWLSDRVGLRAGVETDAVPVTLSRSAVARPTVAAMWIRGTAWALMPCGLLYSALALGVMAASPIGSAATMGAFGVGTWIGLDAMKTALTWLQPRIGRWLLTKGDAASNRGMGGDASIATRMDTMAIRVGGAAVALMAMVALNALAMGQSHPFCIH